MTWAGLSLVILFGKWLNCLWVYNLSKNRVEYIICLKLSWSRYCIKFDKGKVLIISKFCTGLVLVGFEPGHLGCDLGFTSTSHLDQSSQRDLTKSRPSQNDLAKSRRVKHTDLILERDLAKYIQFSDFLGH